jgi:hypothetical protein
MTLGLTLLLTEMSTRNISILGLKAAFTEGLQPNHLHVPIVMKYGSLNFLVTSGNVKESNGIVLILYHVIEPKAQRGVEL